MVGAGLGGLTATHALKNSISFSQLEKRLGAAGRSRWS
ncbi:MAG: hypothetical protein ACRD82_12605 [Blastocatellia bacterium]